MDLEETACEHEQLYIHIGQGVSWLEEWLLASRNDSSPYSDYQLPEMTSPYCYLSQKEKL
jgi:hypothetical protein